MSVVRSGSGTSGNVMRCIHCGAQTVVRNQRMSTVIGK